MLRVAERDDGTGWSVVEDTGKSVEVVDGYLRHITAQAFSPHTVRAYAYDLLTFWLRSSKRGSCAHLMILYIPN